jgi:uncharacterized protein YwgA
MDLPERLWVPLLALKAHGGRLVASLKLQKLVFLIQTEGRIQERYRFVKKYYGPYSEELGVDMTLLQAMEMVTVTTRVSNWGNPYSIYELTPKGQRTIEDIRPSIEPQETTRLEEIVGKYKPMNHDVITSYVYERYVMDPGQFQGNLKHARENVWSLRETWSILYSPDCYASMTYLAMLDYVSLGLKKIETVQDPVIKSVWLSTVLELTARLISATEACAPEGKCSHANPSSEILELINYLNEYSQRNSIVPSLGELDLAETMSKEEADRLQEIVQQGV